MRLPLLFTFTFGLLWKIRADLCAAGSQDINGNLYCQAVDAIQYSNVGAAGTYNEVIEMTSAGTCHTQPKAFSGPLSPLDEEVSLHFRGPLQLKQVAVYVPSKSATKRNERKLFSRQSRQLKHKHHEIRKQKRAKEEMEERQIVTATIDGQVVTWENNYFGAPSGEAAKENPVQVTATIDGQVVSWTNNYFGESTPAPATTVQSVPNHNPVAEAIANPPSTQPTHTSTTIAVSTPSAQENPHMIATGHPTATTSPTASAGAGTGAGTGASQDAGYERIGVYDSVKQTLDNLVFLGNYGGQGSGVFDYHFGASLAYVNSAGTGGAPSPRVLADTTIPSDAEVIVMLGEPCNDGDCGFVRPGSVAYHGFGGPDKVFLLEFAMPSDGTSGFNADMPAVWMLNANIPRTLQYGDPNCSCWESGCGEFDIAEALSTGSAYLKSTLHTNKPAGDSDYFQRPVSGTMKMAIIFSPDTSSIHIQVLPQDTKFPTTLTTSEVKGMYATQLANLVSDFAVS